MHLSELAILLIEPSSTQRKIILSHLSSEGISMIDGVETGAEALHVMATYPPDLIISAMYLPDMTATTLLHTVRTNKKWAATPFMLVSSETNSAILEPVRQAGVVAILPKPFDHTDLRRALRTTLDYIEPEEMQLNNYEIADLRVLLVDDSTLARKHIQRVLTDIGITHIETAENGLHAAQRLTDIQYDLIVTDLNMPEMDGQALTKFIRTELNDRYVPILLVTSEQDQTRLEQVQQAGVSAICDKPFEPHAIRDLLYRIFEEPT